MYLTGVVAVKYVMSTDRTPYPSDVTDAEWVLAAPYLTLMTEDAPQREYGLREVLNALRWLVKTGGQWRMMPHDFPPWPAVYQQARRWVAAGCFEAMTHDLREAARVAAGRAASPTAAILDGRTLQSTPESGGRGGYDGAKRRKGSKVHAAVDTLGNLLALTVTAADAALAGGRPGGGGAGGDGPDGDAGVRGPGVHGRSRRPTRRPTGCGWRSSSRPRRSGGSYSCRGGGWSSGRSGGWPDSAGWRGTTSGWPRCWPGGTGWRSRGYYSAASLNWQPKVHNSL